MMTVYFTRASTTARPFKKYFENAREFNADKLA